MAALFRKDLLANIGMIVLVACALIVTSLVVRREFVSPRPDVRPVEVRVPRDQRVAEWRDYAAGGHTSGLETAPVTIVTFSDFQCPACRILADSLSVLLRNHPDNVRIVYRHFPLPGHTFAVAAARASECAAAQKRFWQFHDALFAHQDGIGVASWSDFAERAKVPDLRAFEACTTNTRELRSLSEDILMASRLGVTVTPTLLINEKRIEGAPPLAVLEEYLASELRKHE